MTAIPGLSYFLPTDYAGYVFPPLGTFEPAARALTVLAAAFATLVAYYLPRKKPLTSIAFCAALFIAAMLLYGWSFTRYVRKVQIPTRDQSIMVSIGNQRTQFAAKNFPDQSDWDLLKQRGFGEEEIEKLWTMDSILLGRLLLWSSVIGLAVFSVAALGVGIASEAQSKEA